jgi:NAD(P)-dependent dehydrogenase (short-subunit alcohol dehydrogenase family)
LENVFESAFIVQKEEVMPNPSIHAFAEKVAVVTGAESPVARAIAIQLALNGAFVTTASHSEAGASSLTGLLELGTLANHLTVDTGSASGAEAIANDLESRFGRIDLLVDVRNIPRRTNPETESIEVANYLQGPLSNLVEMMGSRPSPRLVSVLMGSPVDPEIERAFRAELAVSAEKLADRFRINGLIVTGLSSIRPVGELLEARSGTDADDVARVAMFFLSGESKAVNGQVLVV